MKRFNKIYLEISNICNLSCSFCPGTKRAKHIMTETEFSSLLPKLRPYADYLYFHLMGEPLLHPCLEKLLHIAYLEGFKVIITTNGTLLPHQKENLLTSPALHKINISLHAFEVNDLSIPFDDYLDNCFRFGKAAEGKKIVVYRLWNGGGADTLNSNILSRLTQHFPTPWKEGRKGTRIGELVFLEYGEKFDWPDLSAEEGSNRMYCYGLRDQIGILCDGTVVPCCLDHDGDIPLGNLHTLDLDTIINSPRAKAIYQGFENRLAAEELCRKCGYARRFL